jgi:hypothetical protein
MYIKKYPKYVIKGFFKLMSRLFFNYFYTTLKWWLQEEKNPYTYFHSLY